MGVAVLPVAVMVVVVLVVVMCVLAWQENGSCEFFN